MPPTRAASADACRCANALFRRFDADGARNSAADFDALQYDVDEMNTAASITMSTLGLGARCRHAPCQLAARMSISPPLFAIYAIFYMHARCRARRVEMSAAAIFKHLADAMGRLMRCLPPLINDSPMRASCLAGRCKMNAIYSRIYATISSMTRCEAASHSYLRSAAITMP